MKSFEELLVEGALTALRTLTLDQLYDQKQHLVELNLPEELSEFPLAALNTVIFEKQLQRQLN